MNYRIILTILFYAFSPICFAQHLTYSDIVKINRLSRMSEISDYVTQRGYVYADTNQRDSVSDVYWARNCESVNTTTGDFEWKTGKSRSLLKLEVTNKFHVIHYELPSRNAFNTLSTTLKANGFRFQKEQISRSVITLTYKRLRGKKTDFVATYEKPGGYYSCVFWFNYPTE